MKAIGLWGTRERREEEVGFFTKIHLASFALLCYRTPYSTQYTCKSSSGLSNPASDIPAFGAHKHPIREGPFLGRVPIFPGFLSSRPIILIIYLGKHGESRTKTSVDGSERSFNVPLPISLLRVFLSAPHFPCFFLASENLRGRR